MKTELQPIITALETRINWLETDRVTEHPHENCHHVRLEEVRFFINLLLDREKEKPYE